MTDAEVRERADWFCRKRSREDILVLPAGEELDGALSFRLLGFGLPSVELSLLPRFPPLSYSRSACWLVVNALADRNVRLVLEDWRSSPMVTPQTNGWAAYFTMPDGHDTGSAVAPDFPLAICRAALVAVELMR